METIARFSTLSEAYLKRSVLEACGIDAFIPDEYSAQVNWMYIGAMGGIRLQVPEESVKEAGEILNLDFEHEKGNHGVSILRFIECAHDGTVPLECDLTDSIHLRSDSLP